MHQTSQSFPGVYQSIGLLAILITLMFASAGVASFMNVELAWSVTLTYLISMGIAVMVGFKLKTSYEGGLYIHFGHFSSRNLGFVVLLAVLMIGVLDPIGSLIETPASLKTVILSIMEYPTVALFAMVIFPSVLEELLFRGIILDGLMGHVGAWKAIVFSALLFGLIHMNLIQGIGAFLGGLFFGWIYLKTGSIVYPILAHSINNGIAWLLLLNGIEADSFFEIFNGASWYYIVYPILVLSFTLIIFLLNKQLKLGTNQ